MKKKVYKDFDEVVKPTRVPKKLWKYEDEMKKKPNSNKYKNTEEKPPKK